MTSSTSDYLGVSAELTKVEEWRKQPPRIRVGNSSKPEAVRDRQEFIAGFSMDALEDFGQLYQSRSGWFAEPKDKAMAMFEPIIGLKKHFDD